MRLQALRNHRRHRRQRGSECCDRFVIAGLREIQLEAASLALKGPSDLEQSGDADTIRRLVSEEVHEGEVPHQQPTLRWWRRLVQGSQRLLHAAPRALHVAPLEGLLVGLGEVVGGLLPRLLK